MAPVRHGYRRREQPQLPPLRPDLNLREGFFQAKRKQNTRAVGADLNAGTDFLELVRLFINLDIDATLELLGSDIEAPLDPTA